MRKSVYKLIRNHNVSPVLFFLAISCCLVALGAAASVAETLDANLKTLQSVGNEGKGNPSAAVAWQEVADCKSDSIPTILSAIDGASPLSANWIRTAVDAIAGRSRKIPLEDLEVFLSDVRHDPRARRLAWELIQQRNPKRAETIISSMLDDPGVELRYDAVDRLIQKASQANEELAVNEILRKALDAARNVDQVKQITTALRKSGQIIDLQHHFGFLAGWYVAGPFDNTDGKGFATVYPPEENVDLQALYAGKGMQVLWHEFLTADPYGMVDINKAIPGPGDGLKEVVAYAFTTFTMPVGQEVEVRLGCKNAWKIWGNGSLLFERDEYHRGMRIDQYRIPFEMREGENTLLVKLCQDGQAKDWTKEWQFQLRLCDASGTPVLGSDRRPTPRHSEAEATHGELQIP